MKSFYSRCELDMQAVGGVFEEEGLIINVETLPRPWSTPSEARMIRELGTGPRTNKIYDS